MKQFPTLNPRRRVWREFIAQTTLETEEKKELSMPFLENVREDDELEFAKTQFGFLDKVMVPEFCVDFYLPQDVFGS